MSDPITSGRHNDFVGGEASKHRIPGADQATTGHSFVAVDLPRDQKRHADARRPEEHLPPPTGRDAPPAGGVSPGSRTSGSGPLPSDILSQREAAARQPSPVHRIDNDVQPLPPAPDSRTVIDKDPYATPTSAGDTLQGATSKDVYGGLGMPAGGMSSAEMHHDGQAHRKKQHLGADQYGSGEIPREAE
ncbi:hypothetical protein L226DRAFT_520012 [Lentinus tigrinus ALCF2SS1-7]|uniref:Uncharacterized protein n=1 Tax=Lentinus tigrinus ALCF2SS1-6 TaxID=1328759 RepID=A0A5C2SQP9_9APHY|nr:hypothetical protein L227DRAFT_607155 [Lentinus tigrinus ALCF2SS1-6]RPD78911.1 hypothetical protein L226DRAFT_520012 [Lentinus tigrinus ALCF2SS1-7]